MTTQKTYVVTGCNRGLGFGMTAALLAKGLRVVGACRNPSRASALKVLEEKYGSLFTVAELDLEDPKSIQHFAKNLAHLAQVDCLINNAGLFSDNQNKLQSISYEGVEQSFRVNALGPMRVTEALLPLLKKAKQPRIVHISTLMASIGDNATGGAYAYRMSKAALNMFMKCFALEYPDGIHIALHPGWVKTDMGGASAPLGIEESVAGMLRVIEQLKATDTGCFLDYKGARLPW